MDKIVIHIYGASGAGTSTIGKYISDELGFYFMDTDDYFWQPTNPPYTTKRNKSDRVSLMRNDIFAHNNVVISGSLVDWGDELIPLFSLAIRVETDTKTRIERLIKREREQFGKRIDRGGDMYENRLEFLNWAASYDDGGLGMRSKAEHDEWQNLLKCKRISIDGRMSVESNFQLIKQYL
jgi:adenylate kinase family enzyme